MKTIGEALFTLAAVAALLYAMATPSKKNVHAPVNTADSPYFLLLEQLDQNLDARLTKDEVTEKADRHLLFDLIDANKDGVVVRDEVLKYDAKMRGDSGGVAPVESIRSIGMTDGSREVVKCYDQDGDGRLNSDERAIAREVLEINRSAGVRDVEPSFRGVDPENAEAYKPGPSVDFQDVKSYPDASLYEPTAIRTLFLEFENQDWESELFDFQKTDVDVPATLTVDGETYPNVGVHFQGSPSYYAVPAGCKRSLNLKIDFADPKQRLLGYKTLHLLNSHEDPSFLSSVLYSFVARQYIPAPQANFVKLVINGESWGVYANVQDFNDELRANGKQTDEVARWKAKNVTFGGGKLDYIGDDVADYKRRYEIESNDAPQSWQALIDLCQVLGETPNDQLEQALKPILNLDGLLWFLALDVTLANCDGYWIGANDYGFHLDENGKFHVTPRQMSDAFRPSNEKINPLLSMDDPRKPLYSRVLAVPRLRKIYLQHVAEIADKWLDWKTLGPIVAAFRDLIVTEVQADSHKLTSFESFRKTTSTNDDEPAARKMEREMNLHSFANSRRDYLLNHSQVKNAAP